MTIPALVRSDTAHPDAGILAQLAELVERGDRTAVHHAASDTALEQHALIRPVQLHHPIASTPVRFVAIRRHRR